jgi:hypothetical protein
MVGVVSPVPPPRLTRDLSAWRENCRPSLIFILTIERSDCNLLSIKRSGAEWAREMWCKARWR